MILTHSSSYNLNTKWHPVKAKTAIELTDEPRGLRRHLSKLSFLSLPAEVRIPIYSRESVRALVADGENELSDGEDMEIEDSETDCLEDEEAGETDDDESAHEDSVKADESDDDGNEDGDTQAD